MTPALTLAQVAYAHSPTLRVLINNRDWEAVAHYWHSTTTMHGTPSFTPEQRQVIRQEAARDGVDIDTLARR